MPKRGPGKCSTVVCNHVGFLEILSLIASPLGPAFAARIGVSKMPIINKLTDGLQSVYINNSDQANRENALDILKERAVSIEDQCIDWNPFCVFPEGTTTNGTGILKFKKGAFSAMRTVRPCYISITGRWFSPCYDVIGFCEYCIFLMASLCMF